MSGNSNRLLKHVGGQEPQNGEWSTVPEWNRLVRRTWILPEPTETVDPDLVVLLHGWLGRTWVFTHHLFFSTIISGLNLAFGIEFSRMGTKADSAVIGMCVRRGTGHVRFSLVLKAVHRTPLVFPLCFSQLWTRDSQSLVSTNYCEVHNIFKQYFYQSIFKILEFLYLSLCKSEIYNPL